MEIEIEDIDQSNRRVIRNIFTTAGTRAGIVNVKPPILQLRLYEIYTIYLLMIFHYLQV
jgi:hypothetical protein